MDIKSIVVIVFMGLYLVGGAYAIYKSEKFKENQYK